jgi:hypothetical protein
MTDAQQAADFWNLQTDNPDSAWFGAPTITAAGIEQRNCSLAVGNGFGIWHGIHALGFTAATFDDFRALLKIWAADNPGRRGIGIVPARPCIETTWLKRLPFTFKPLGHKPMRQGEARKVWTYQVECSLDEL